MSVLFTKRGAVPQITGPLPIGGRIYYDNGPNNALYIFYDINYNKITDTSISGLANAVYYSIIGIPTQDRWYVYDNTTHNTGSKVTTNGLIDYINWGYYRLNTHANTSSGKINTQTVLAIVDTSEPPYSIFQYIAACNRKQLNGCSDWFIPSMSEQNILRASGLVTWYSDKSIWSSNDYDKSYAYQWVYNQSGWDYLSKSPNASSGCAFAARSF